LSDTTTTTKLLATLLADGAPPESPETGIAHAILERLDDAVLLFDRQWRIAYVNGRAERNMGRPRAEVLGRVLWELYPDLASTPFGELYLRAMDAGETDSAIDFVPRHGAWFEVRARPTAAGLLIIARDISRQKLLEAERDAAFAREREARARPRRRAASRTSSSRPCRTSCARR
jgi:PAS domain S-box-containing protein